MQVLRITLPFVPNLGDLKERRQALHMLPQAHTCANILELPDYWAALLHDSLSAGLSAAGQAPQEQQAGEGPGGEQLQLLQQQQRCRDVLRERLLLAITCCAGYDLDDAGGGPGGGGATSAAAAGQWGAAERSGPGPASSASSRGRRSSSGGWLSLSVRGRNS
jgi:hypothetical protein